MQKICVLPRTQTLSRSRPDCAHFVSWYCSCSTLSCTIGQLVLLTSQRVHSRAQQIEQPFRISSLELRHGVGSVSVVWAPPRSTHRSTHELFNDWYPQCRLPVILREIVVQCVEQAFGIHDKSALGIVVVWIFVSDHMRHQAFERSTRSSLREKVKVSPSHRFPQRFDPCHLNHG